MNLSCRMLMMNLIFKEAMKTNIILATLLAVSTFFLVGCSREPSSSTPEENLFKGSLVKKTFQVSCVKTSLGSDGQSVIWSATDKIRIFDETSTCASYEAFTTSGAGASTSITGFVDASASDF